MNGNSSPKRLLSISSGAFVDGSNFIPDFPPEMTVRAAHEAGFQGVGLWFDAERWSNRTIAALARTLHETGTIALDIEAVWIQPGSPNPNHERLIGAGGEIGAKNVLILSSEPDKTNTMRRFASLCELAEGAGMYACLEFLSITEIRSLADALEIIAEVDHPNARLLIDPLHLARSGGHPGELTSVSTDLLSYAQLCDAPAEAPGDGSFDARWEEAVAGRLLPGDGELPLTELVESLPDGLPLSVELWSRQLRDDYPEAVDRARAVLEATQRFLG